MWMLLALLLLLNISRSDQFPYASCRRGLPYPPPFSSYRFHKNCTILWTSGTKSRSSLFICFELDQFEEALSLTYLWALVDWPGWLDMVWHSRTRLASDELPRCYAFSTVMIFRCSKPQSGRIEAGRSGHSPSRCWWVRYRQRYFFESLSSLSLHSWFDSQYDVFSTHSMLFGRCSNLRHLATA